MEYKRLTNRDITKVCFDIWELCGLDAVCERDCRKPEPCKIPQIIHRLAELEDKIENGTLVELPCKVGDTVWTINCWQEYGKKELGEPYSVTRYELHENKCSCIEINDKNCYRGEISIIAREKYKGITPYVFLTKAEAEAKLRELKGDKKWK